LEKVRFHVCDAIATRARAKWNNNRPDFVNQAVGRDELRILGLGLREELLDLFEWHSRLVVNYTGDSGMVRVD
jgi:hypothetical protein